MTQPKVSVVIPTYNSRGLVVETIRSALASKLQDIEVVVINDGSTDATSEEVRTILDQRVVLVEQRNQGIGAARNRGIELARGEFIALLDHDDLWEPDYLDRQIGFLQSNPAIGAAICQWDCTDDPAELGLGPSIKEGVLPDVLSGLASGEIKIMSACLVLRTSALGAFRYTPERRVMEDAPFYLELFQRIVVGVSTRSVLMHYRRHQRNTSGDALYFLTGAKKVLQMRSEGKLLTTGALGYAATVCRQACRKLSAQGHGRAAIATYLESFPLQYQLRRWKFLIAMPIEIARGKVSNRRVGL